MPYVQFGVFSTRCSATYIIEWLETLRAGLGKGQQTRGKMKMEISHLCERKAPKSWKSSPEPEGGGRKEHEREESRARGETVDTMMAATLILEQILLYFNKLYYFLLLSLSNLLNPSSLSSLLIKMETIVASTS